MSGQQKTAIVTGGSQGIGAGLVKAFLGRGYNVVANSRNITRSGAFESSNKLALVDGNIAEPATAAKIVEAAKSTFGSIDALVNNAGIFFSKRFTDYSIEDLRSLISVNIEGFFFITQLSIKQMLAQGTGGSIVNITTTLVDHPIAASKCAVPMLTKAVFRLSPEAWRWSMQKKVYVLTPSRRVKSIRLCIRMTRRIFSRRCNRWEVFPK